ncbi:hypothetical protein ATZ33_01835 [Enterococcus silesiacus]|uniref:Lipoprotein n=1 Tax=Enterococcus silesiacus TaxID=332949 RepID=A0A0S3K784_9ENTE|nr:hypothetical protein [Enterococcus silesiacus]ALS00161.1 hypothetical protein ATZ33_01835 [Enterococcus silesiacus]OJG86243.1 hypothetical protein RV15_GL002428 [Enterococcus silesiacus]
MKRVTKLTLCVFFVLILFFAGCSSKANEGDLDKKIYNLETSFKETYQLWVDMKNMGEIKNKEYPKDLRKVATDFKIIGDKAKLSSYQKLLSEEDKMIYETYRQLSPEIKELARTIEKSSFEQAKTQYELILEKEEGVKE